MTDKTKKRARAFAREHGVSYQAAVNHQRRPLHRLLNLSEMVVEANLRRTAQSNGARVFSKIRFPDVVRIDNSGITDPEYRYALQSHLDFVVTDGEENPIFALELDGSGHDSKRDEMKNALSERFGLPLARVSSRHANMNARGLNIIAWLAELEFIYRAMEKAQGEGSFPEDEPIDPFSIYSWEINGERFPLSFMIATSARIHRLRDAGRIPAATIFHIAVNADGRATAAATARVGVGRFLMATESLYMRGFGVGAGEAASELAAAKLGAELTSFVNGAAVSSPTEQVHARLAEITKGGGFCSGGGSSDPEDFALEHFTDADGQLASRIVPPRGGAVRRQA